jgi:hypothetical protein
MKDDLEKIAIAVVSCVTAVAEIIGSFIKKESEGDE